MAGSKEIKYFNGFNHVLSKCFSISSPSSNAKMYLFHQDLTKSGYYHKKASKHRVALICMSFFKATHQVSVSGILLITLYCISVQVVFGGFFWGGGCLYIFCLAIITLLKLIFIFFHRIFSVP